MWVWEIAPSELEIKQHSTDGLRPSLVEIAPLALNVYSE
jgi:hypothetical protein